MTEARSGKVIVACSRDGMRRSFNTSRPVKVGAKFRLRYEGEEYMAAEVVAHVSDHPDEVPWLFWQDELHAEVRTQAGPADYGRSADGHCHHSGDGNHQYWNEHDGHPEHRHDAEGRTEWVPRPVRPAFDLRRYADQLMRQGTRKMAEGLRDVEEGDRLKKMYLGE